MRETKRVQKQVFPAVDLAVAFESEQEVESGKTDA